MQISRNTKSTDLMMSAPVVMYECLGFYPRSLPNSDTSASTSLMLKRSLELIMS
ncbi:hypothetical protein DFP98_13943 [Cohnella phaseoli]|uniref:Uncharacterized protein n=1 Tax=Cohnella phaseoli TaxID=456490 RepID=A0A3D9I4B6_9BACL|nr:hypothetical protein DFP98_13943 [Cohnella phaseoli]